MKIKKWQIILASLLALVVMVVTPVFAMAAADDSATGTDSYRPLNKGGLAIVAPHVVRVNQQMNMQVWARRTLEAVADAGVWAVNRDDVAVVKEDLKNLKNSVPDPTEEEIAAVLDSGIFMGRTDETGKLSYTFTAIGNYVIITAKAHYWPDFCWTAVRDGQLGITAPKHANIDEEITLNVFRKEDQEPVAEAAVWAIPAANVKTVREKIAELREAGELKDADAGSLLPDFGTKLGETDADGQLVASFAAAGRYALVAVKKGFLPGFTGIAVGDNSLSPAADVTTP